MAYAILRIPRAGMVFPSLAWERVPFERPAQNGATFWSADRPYEIVIPSGVNLVEVSFFASGPREQFAGNGNITIRKNGFVLQRVWRSNIDSSCYSVTTGLLPVNEGDVIDLWGRTATNPQIVWDGDMGYLSVCTWGDRLGYFNAGLNADTTILEEQALVWTPTEDTLGAGTVGTPSADIVVPDGVGAAFINLTANTTAFDSSRDLRYRVKIKGRTDREWATGADGYASTPASFGVLEVLPGDVINITAFGRTSGTLNAALSKLSLEWLASPGRPLDLTVVDDSRAQVVVGDSTGPVMRGVYARTHVVIST